MIENDIINQENIRRFKYFGCNNQSYVCCLCGNRCFTDESFSNCGDRLICNNCYHTKFKNHREARNWIDRKEVTENENA